MEEKDYAKYSPYRWSTSTPPESVAYVWPAILKLLPVVDKPLRILDAGCGNGAISGRLADLGHQVVGIDASEDGIRLARQAHRNVHFEVASVYEDLTSLVGEIDLVVSTEVIEHLYFPKRFLQNMASVLRPGGWIILSTPYHGYLKNLAISIANKWDKHFHVEREGGHIKFFSEKSLSRLLENTGFGDVVFENAGRIPWLWKSMVCRARKNE